MRHINAGLELAPLLEKIAYDAGKQILRVYAQTNIKANSKADQSPVTAADLLAHESIVRGLHATFPGVPVVSEEDDASLAWRLPKGCYWLVDPLDGTKEFLNRNGDFTVNIALIENGQATFGMVYAPAHDTFYWGGAGLGAAMREKGVVTVLARKGSESRYPNEGESAHKSRLRVVASKSHLNEQTQTFIQQLGDVELVQAGSSLKFCTIARGQADLYPRLGPTCEWDTAAAHAVLEGAGGVVLDIHGQPLHYGKANVLNPWFVAAARGEDARSALRLNAANLPLSQPTTQKPHHD
ncbi:3'(2'),5'-bisphosphate nucleotidase CysQ [Pusillimonas sp. DMV24BSW_D]|uniref:3'(2'),5'-bisphosphate nucleotidase CysQ n=1 Tax=Neopusillimonas aestuarii TaxID=2716226 RepID=UPI001408057F|nr:3'(2'),5'-bisphosphate nucleotidase CysQ [Pusillimonas sp. DMV24BSW_D]QIM48110.1 3'(2'),5'-bisphosphate nucleotidase CysQ [Pusillimonas sp. DMV24BSW_D]